MVNQQIFLPMIPDSAPIVINISQYDYDAPGYAGRLYFNLISNGTAYDMNGATAVFQGEKPDGTTFAYPGVVVNASVVRVNVRQQMTLVAGRVRCNLVLNNSEGQVGSFNVWLEVQESATAGSDPSQTDIPALVAQAKQYADDAAQSAADAAAWSANPPYIGANNNWFVYDTDTAQYVDSGVEALGKGIVSIEKTSTSGLVDTYTITYTGGETSTFTVTNGQAPDISISVTSDGTSSPTPTANVTKGGTPLEPTYRIDFTGLKGQQGPQGEEGPTGPTGNGITSIVKTATAGLVDTYTIYMSNGSTATFTVTNGQDGTGSGDMTRAVYDPTTAVADAGGIVAYVAAHAAVYTGGTGISISNQNVISVDADSTPTSGSAKPVTSGGVFTSLSNKADKVAGATNGNFAGLDANGNLTDSGSKAGDFYGISDTAESTLDDADYIPFYDTSATAKRKTLWSTIKSTIKTYFDTVYAAIADLDTWTATATVSSGTVSFSGINDTNNNGYKPFCLITSSSTNKNPSFQISSISGEGTASMSVSFTTDADNGASVKLRIVK